MNCIEHHCQGESHKSSNKPCQDCAYAESTSTWSLAIVCDGHGGERYFRSQYGAQIATEITRKAICEFVQNMADSTWSRSEGKAVFDGAPFTAYSAATATDEQMESPAHQSLMWLFSSIISQWNAKIAEHAKATDLTDWEMNHVDEKYRNEFLLNREKDDTTFEKTYGCTLMAYVQTPDYWFSFHVGDGKCVSMRVIEERLVCEQPIPWDDRCFLNKTTSLCDSNALEEFRYCYQGDGNFPLAMFLGSDGMDDSYGDGYNLYNFYIQLYKMIIRKGVEKAHKELKKYLPVISRMGSKDDMSVAGIFDDSCADTFFLLTQYQRSELESARHQVEDQMQELQKKIDSVSNPETLDRGQQINYEYARKDLEKAKEKAIKLDRKLRFLKGEETRFRNQLKGTDSVPSPDESDDSEE